MYQNHLILVYHLLIVSSFVFNRDSKLESLFLYLIVSFKKNILKGFDENRDV